MSKSNIIALNGASSLGLQDSTVVATSQVQVPLVPRCISQELPGPFRTTQKARNTTSHANPGWLEALFPNRTLLPEFQCRVPSEYLSCAGINSPTRSPRPPQIQLPSSLCSRARGLPLQRSRYTTRRPVDPRHSILNGSNTTRPAIAGEAYEARAF
jgi:hypothetical protein